MSKRLLKALDAQRRAEDAVAAILKADYPVGAEIAWDWADRAQYGVVSMHSSHSSDRIKVINGGTGKELWIHAYRVRP